jgi:hypothetical protein
MFYKKKLKRNFVFLEISGTFSLLFMRSFAPLFAISSLFYFYISLVFPFISFFVLLPPFFSYISANWLVGGGAVLPRLHP